MNELMFELRSLKTILSYRAKTAKERGFDERAAAYSDSVAEIEKILYRHQVGAVEEDE